MSLRLCFLSFALLWLAATPSQAQIYADVTVTGGVTGTFTITLEHQKTPATVANFIGLATGQRGWLDRLTGAIRYDNFYAGVTFHRVIKGFINQTGSRAGDGTDGPGYSFRDEFDASLVHDGPFVVSMANSGRNTNGSQIFITAGPATHLNGVHTVFGHVTAGQAVCTEINNVATNPANDRPLTPVSIQAIQVYGPSLAGFSLDQPKLPTLRNSFPTLTRSGATWTLEFERMPFSDYFIYRSADLTSWSRLATGYFGTTAPTSGVDVSSTITGFQGFYRFGRADYTTSATSQLSSNTIHFSNVASLVSGTAALNSTRTGGTWTFDDGTAYAISTATYTIQSPYGAQLFLQLSNDMRFLFVLQANTLSGGPFTGQSNISGFTTLSGTFSTLP